MLTAWPSKRLIEQLWPSSTFFFAAPQVWVSPLPEGCSSDELARFFYSNKTGAIRNITICRTLRGPHLPHMARRHAIRGLVGNGRRCVPLHKAERVPATSEIAGIVFRCWACHVSSHSSTHCAALKRGTCSPVRCTGSRRKGRRQFAFVEFVDENSVEVRSSAFLPLGFGGEAGTLLVGWFEEGGWVGGEMEGQERRHHALH